MDKPTTDIKAGATGYDVSLCGQFVTSADSYAEAEKIASVLRIGFYIGREETLKEQLQKIIEDAA